MGTIALPLELPFTDFLAYPDVHFLGFKGPYALPHQVVAEFCF